MESLQVENQIIADIHSGKIFPASPEQIKNLLNEGKWKDAITLLLPPDSLRRKSVIYQKSNDTYSVVAREHWISKYRSWALPPRVDQISEILEVLSHRNILEIAAGAGLWSAILKSSGMNIIATDEMMKGQYMTRMVTPFTYTNIETLSANDALLKYGSTHDILFVCWGSLSNIDLNKENFQHFTGDTIMIVGEPGYGCTYQGYINEAIETSNWKLVLEVNIPIWRGVNDNLTIYRRV